jgi:hypothetical protein
MSVSDKYLVMSSIGGTYGGNASREDAACISQHMRISLRFALISEARASARFMRRFFRHKHHQTRRQRDARPPSFSSTATKAEEIEDTFITKHGRQAGLLAMRDDMF